MKTLNPLLATIALLALSLTSFAQEPEMALLQLNEEVYVDHSATSFLTEETQKAKRNKITKSARFRASADFTNLSHYLSENVEFPDEARDLGVSGVVKVSFDILPDGSLNNIKVIESPLNLFSETLISVMESMPIWSPAYKQGMPIASRQELHVNFRLP